MSKFCENCGAEMADDEVVCKYCAPQEEVKVEEPTNTTAEGAKTADKKPMDVKNIAIIGGIAAAVIIILILLFSLLGGGYEKPIKNYFKGMEKSNAEMYMKAFPEFMDYDYDDDDMEDMMDYLEDEYGEKIKISYKIKDKEKIKKDDLEDIQKYIEEIYDEEVKVKAGYEVKVKATIKGKDGDESNTEEMYVYKIDGKWCYFDVSPKSAREDLKD